MGVLVNQTPSQAEITSTHLIALETQVPMKVNSRNSSYVRSQVVVCYRHGEFMRIKPVFFADLTDQVRISDAVWEQGESRISICLKVTHWCIVCQCPCLTKVCLVLNISTKKKNVTAQQNCSVHITVLLFT